jgi:GTP cyclohydrolase I
MPLVERIAAERRWRVILHARHLCMEMRGVQIAGTVTTTSALRGVFLDDARCRREFLEFDAKSV